MRPKIGLALGSGGLRGLAHVGVLKVLAEEDIPVDYIAGCSIGSMIGALYCAGQSTENILKLARHLKPRYWLDFVIPKMGVVAGDKLLDIMRLLTRQKNFAELTIPLAIVATELNHGREVVFTEGDLAKAIRASISVPGIFVPFQIGDMLLVDGAVVNPTPIDVARRMGADIVIAVDLAHAGLIGTVSNIFDVIIQSIDIMERELFKHRQHHCDILIRPDVAHISPSSFEAMDECVALGEQATTMVIPAIKQLLSTMECKSVNDESPTPLSSSGS